MKYSRLLGAQRRDCRVKSFAHDLRRPIIEGAVAGLHERQN
jgi:hypothetical protein